MEPCLVCQMCIVSLCCVVSMCLTHNSTAKTVELWRYNVKGDEGGLFAYLGDWLKAWCS